MTGLLAAVRFVHLGALTLALGSFGFLLVVARPAFERSGALTAGDEDGDAALGTLDRSLFRLVAWSLAVGAVTAIAWLVVQATLLSGTLSPDAVMRVLTRTQFGRLWQVRLGLFVLLALLFVLRRHERDRRDWLTLRGEFFGLTALLLALVAWAGHAAGTAPTWRTPHLTADVIHLLATAVWIGGLPALALLLTRTRRSRHPTPGAVAIAATRRFSTLALACVIALVVTGVVNTSILAGDVASLVGTPYGRWLLLKVGILVLILLAATVNRLRLTPRLRTGASSAPVVAALEWVRRNVIAEACGGVFILLVVGILGVTPPGRHTEPVWPFSFRLSWNSAAANPDVRAIIMASLAGAALGLLILVGTVLFRHGRPWIVALGLAVITVSAALARPVLSVDAYPTTYVRSPVPYSAVSISRGEALYAKHCAVCHGAGGEGDGPAARALTKRPADLTGSHTAAHTAGDMFWWLTYGIKNSPMPGFAAQITPRDRWDLINFLRALSAGETARALTASLEPPRVVAPDFGFGIGFGPSETLKQQRGRGYVLLVLFTLPNSLPRLDQLDRAWSTLGFAGVRIIAVPMAEADHVYRQLGPRAANFTIAVDGAEEVTRAYALFRHTWAPKRVGDGTAHMEFLVDRQGYLRARGRPDRDAGWADIGRLLAEVQRLDKEPASEPAPEEHVH
ncbi:MAG: hypothetical protein C5B48_06475 [Candidatus Rokuibacteriota bacterium]|nr:MAG: hypothetical protein C5B48_06475 [Candidatus Rokubacteria bacterium]